MVVVSEMIFPHICQILLEFYDLPANDIATLCTVGEKDKQPRISVTQQYQVILNVGDTWLRWVIASLIQVTQWHVDKVIPARVSTGGCWVNPFFANGSMEASEMPQIVRFLFYLFIPSLKTACTGRFLCAARNYESHWAQTERVTEYKSEGEEGRHVAKVKPVLWTSQWPLFSHAGPSSTTLKNKTKNSSKNPYSKKMKHTEKYSRFPTTRLQRPGWLRRYHLCLRPPKVAHREMEILFLWLTVHHRAPETSRCAL